ncbi:hypothetical protein TcWFU_001410 [Taenia crassiceps]|uniref:Uncharacterized protein n=1 Tax=Taenia crassiceps TaxID=6207 RepID=A0ABR4Q7K0_9CEST
MPINSFDISLFAGFFWEQSLMSDSNSLKGDCLDSLDPEEYVFGLVHFPPGCDVKKLFSSAVESMLLKFFRKLARHPSTPFRKRIPSSQALELCYEGPSSHTRLPFLGRSSAGGYCLRQLDVQRLQICLGNDVDGENNAEADTEDVDEKTAESTPTRKRQASDGRSSTEGPLRKRRKTERNHL